MCSASLLSGRVKDLRVGGVGGGRHAGVGWMLLTKPPRVPCLAS